MGEGLCRRSGSDPGVVDPEEAVLSLCPLFPEKDVSVFLGGEGSSLFLEGGESVSLLEGGEGTSLLEGEGVSSLLEGEGVLFLEGGEGVLFLEGGEGTSLLEGGEGTSLLEGGEGVSLLEGEGVSLLEGEGTSLFLEGGEGTSLLEGGEGSSSFLEAEDAVESSLIMFKITVELPSLVILSIDSFTNGCYSLNHLTVTHFHQLFHTPSLFHILHQTLANEINEFRGPFVFGERWGFFIVNPTYYLQITQLQ